MFRSYLHRILMAVATVWAVLGVGGCVQPLNLDSDDGPHIWFELYLPGGDPAVKSDPDPVASVSSESTLYDIQVWACLHGTEASDPVVGYSEVSDISIRPSKPDYYRMMMRLPPPR